MIKFAMSRPVTVFMFFVAVVLFGVVSLDRLALNLLPDISYPSLTVQTDYPDAAPEEVESLITRPIEEAVGVVPGLTRLSSVSRSGQSEVVLEFGWKTNMDLVALDVREKLDVVNLPRDVERPVILRFDPSYDPIMRLQLYGDLSLSRLRYAAEKELKKNLESTEGVAAIKVIGGLEEQIRIEIDEKRLAELGIPITQVTQILAQENLNQASGSLYDLDANYLVRMLNQFRSVEEPPSADDSPTITSLTVTFNEARSKQRCRRSCLAPFSDRCTETKAALSPDAGRIHPVQAIGILHTLREHPLA